MYSFQVSIIKILQFKHITNWPIQDVSQILRVLHHFIKISLIKCLIDRSFQICNNWKSFHDDVKTLNSIQNAYPPFLIDKVIKKYLHYKFPSNQNQLKDKSDVLYPKLPYIGNILHHIKNKLRNFAEKILTLT